MFLIKNVPRAVKFYQEGLGCSVKYASEEWAELASGNYVFQFNKVEG